MEEVKTFLWTSGCFVASLAFYGVAFLCGKIVALCLLAAALVCIAYVSFNALVDKASWKVQVLSLFVALLVLARVFTLFGFEFFAATLSVLAWIAGCISLVNVLIYLSRIKKHSCL